MECWRIDGRRSQASDIDQPQVGPALPRQDTARSPSTEDRRAHQPGDLRRPGGNAARNHAMNAPEKPQTARPGGRGECPRPGGEVWREGGWNVGEKWGGA